MIGFGGNVCYNGKDSMEKYGHGHSKFWIWMNVNFIGFPNSFNIYKKKKMLSISLKKTIYNDKLNINVF